MDSTKSDSVVDEQPNKEKGGAFKVRVGLLSSVLLLTGSIIGTGVFMTPNSIAKAVPSVLFSLLIWFFCAILTMLSSLCYAELGLLYPVCGGEYTYLEYAFHPSVSFSFMLTNFLLTKPVSIGIFVLFFAENLLRVAYIESVDIPYWPTRLLASLIMIILCLINCISMKATLQMSNFLTYGKLVCIGILCGCGIYKMAKGEFENLKGAADLISVSPAKLSFAIYNGMWSYDGWNSMAYIVEEMKDVKKNLLRSILISVCLVAFCNVFLNFCYMVVIGLAAVQSSSSVATDTAQIYLGKWSALITVLICLSSIGAGSATYICGCRIYFDASRKGHLPSCFACLHKKTNTLMVVYVLQAFLTIIYILFSKDINSLLLYFSNGTWVYYGATFAGLAVIKYRYKPKNQTFKVPIVIPIILSVISLALIVLSFMDDAVSTGVSIAIIFGTIPLYFIFIFRGGIFRNYTIGWDGAVSNIICKVFHLEIAQNSEEILN